MKITKLVLSVAVIALLLLALAGPGSRFGLWSFGTGFLLMRWALYLGAGAAVLALLLLVIPKTRAGNATLLTLALLIGIGAAWMPLSGYRTARSVPPIHDITTDTVNPPAFVAVLPLRADARNPPEYAGEEVAKQQREAYPELATLVLTQSRGDVFNKALATAKDMGWEIVAAEPDEGRIEATATTFWFGFKDDVVIRIVADDTGSRMDLRSKSRVGLSDVGANAARIHRFVDKFNNR